MKSTHLTLRVLAQPLALAGLLFVQLVSAAPLPNAWQITDNTSSDTGGSYNTNLPPAQQSAALSEGWRYTIHARLLDDFNDTATMVFLYGVGTNRFSIYWDLDAGKNLTATPYNQPTVTLTTNGNGWAFYHTYEIAYNPTSRQATFFFDGIQRAVWDGDDVTSPSGLIAWGSGSSAGQGRMNFHTVTFAVGTTVVATYDAGTQNNPTNAPDPPSQSWTANGTSAATTNAVSPDAVPSPGPLVATTLAPTGVDPHEATLHGAVQLRGLAALAWLEWGATTNYGNISPPQFFKAGPAPVNLFHPLASLPAGTTYHFRCVATNLLGIAYGQDVEFTTQPTVVTSLANSGAGSLRQLIADALAGDTISFGVTGRIVLTSGQLEITKNLTILGPGPADLRIDAGGDSRVFRVFSGATNTFSDITITNGHPAGGPDGGGIHNDGTLTLSNCVVIGNRARKGGDGSSPAEGNGGGGEAGGDGGGIYNSGILTLLACAVTNNAAGNGGDGGDGSDGVFLNPDGGNGGNGGRGGWGGGIYSSGALTCINSRIEDNRAGDSGFGGSGGTAFNVPLANGGDGGDGGDGGSGGGLYLNGAGTLTGCRLQLNLTGYGRGGGIGGSGKQGGAGGTSGSGGESGFGGGLVSRASPTISGCTFDRNEGVFGGAVLVLSGTLTLNDSILTGNFAPSRGGAIYIDDAPATVVVNRSTLSGNDAEYGGGIYNKGILRLENSTLAQNQASRQIGPAGGGIHNVSVLTLNNCTLAGNNAWAQNAYGGGILSIGAIALTNSIVAGNSPDNIAGSFTGANNITSGSAMLGGLANNGGPTQTMPPLASSPAIDAGHDSVTNFLATDQRGYRRRSGARVDIGAVEVQQANSNNPPVLTQPMRLGNGALRFTFTNDPAIAFSVYASTNVAAPSSQWLRLGATTQPTPGQYQYTDQTATNHPARFYQVLWP